MWLRISANPLRRQCGTDVAVSLMSSTAAPAAETAPNTEQLQEDLDRLLELF